MNSIPKTTFGQVAATLTILLLLNLFISFFVLRTLVIDTTALQFAEMIDSQVKLLKINLTGKTAPEAERWLQDNFTDIDYMVKQDIQSLDILPDIHFYRILKKHSKVLSLNLTPIRISHKNDQSWLWIQYKWMNGYHLAIPFRSYINGMFKLVASVFLITTIFSLIAAYLITVYLLSPLKRLAQTATNWQKNTDSLSTSTIKGPLEIQQVTKLVEDATSQMRKVVQDRELILAGVSHDIRSPLACLRVSSEWIKDENLRRDIINDIDTIDKITDSFLSYVRAGNNEKRQMIYLPDFIHSLINNCHRRNQIVTITQSEELSFHLRPVSINRLLCNLIDNAFKFGNPPVTLAYFTHNNQFQIWIKDRGEGIAKESVNHLLSPLTQGEASRTKKGTGLGLSIAKRIADNHNAKLLLENRKSGGLKVGIIFSHSP